MLCLRHRFQERMCEWLKVKPCLLLFLPHLPGSTRRSSLRTVSTFLVSLAGFIYLSQLLIQHNRFYGVMAHDLCDLDAVRHDLYFTAIYYQKRYWIISLEFISCGTLYSCGMPPGTFFMNYTHLFYVPLGPWYMPHTVWSVAPNILGPHSDTILAIGPWPLLGAED